MNQIIIPLPNQVSELITLSEMEPLPRTVMKLIMEAEGMRVLEDEPLRDTWLRRICILNDEEFRLPLPKRIISGIFRNEVTIQFLALLECTDNLHETDKYLEIFDESLWDKIRFIKKQINKEQGDDYNG